MTSFLRSDRSRPVAIWLFCVAAMVFAMVVVGGATRLTGSGLSITEWKPVTGAIPPLNQHAWMAEFQKYQATTQYRYLNRGMSLAQFKVIYGWEWTHRLLGRLVGVVFLVPFLVFLGLRMISSRLIWRCVALFLLGGLQGLVGWWMVVSGLEGRVAVAPERLAAHLGLALILFGALIWTACEAWAGPGRANHRLKWPLIAAGLMILIYLQCLLGALVAGNRAGLVDNDWPLMNGRFFPVDYWSAGAHSLLHSQAAVQFNHRLLAYAIVLAGIIGGVGAARDLRLPDQARGLFVALGLLVLLQAALGVATLMAAAPLSLSAPHQALATLVFGTAVALCWRARRI